MLLEEVGPDALLPCSGQEDYSHIRPLSYQDAHVFLICFAVDNRDSFDNVENKVCGGPQSSYMPLTPVPHSGCLR